MKYFLGSYNFFQYVFFMILYMTWVKLAKLTLLTTRVVLTTSSNNIFDSRDNVTFSSLLSIFILFPVFKCRRGGGKERDRESLKIWQLTALWGQRANISAIIGLWKELSKRKVFKKQLIVCIKRLRQFCGIKKYPKKNRVVRTTHGRRRTYKFICPPPTMRCTYNKPFSSKLLTLQGNGTHSDASFVMLYHIPDLEPNRRQKICPVAKGLNVFFGWLILETIDNYF